jgi:hypothetical protein
MSRDRPTYPDEDAGERIPHTHAKIQAMYDRANVPLSDAGQRIIDAARSNLPRHDEAVARADAARAAFRASADWSKPNAYRTWERLEREYWGACRDRTDCRANACLPRDIEAEIASMGSGQ